MKHKEKYPISSINGIKEVLKKLASNYNCKVKFIDEDRKIIYHINRTLPADDMTFLTAELHQNSIYLTFHGWNLITENDDPKGRPGVKYEEYFELFERIIDIRENGFDDNELEFIPKNINEQVAIKEFRLSESILRSSKVKRLLNSIPELRGKTPKEWIKIITKEHIDLMRDYAIS